MMSTIEGYPSKSVNNLEEIDNVDIIGIIDDISEKKVYSSSNK